MNAHLRENGLLDCLKTNRLEHRPDRSGKDAEEDEY